MYISADELNIEQSTLGLNGHGGSHRFSGTLITKLNLAKVSTITAS